MLSYEPGLVNFSQKNSIIGYFFQKSIEFVIQNLSTFM
jgi:hypothetical protein